MNDVNERRTFLLGLGLVAVVTLSVFGLTVQYPFINYDDPTYITDNQMVIQGLTWEGLRWAFQSTVSHHYHPLTWVSHMLDVELFGMNPGAHHGSAVVIHTLAAVLLFLFVHQWTKQVWASAFVGLVFGIHPLHVESVAWLSERKDVLSALFLSLTLLAYGAYSRRSSLVRYLPVVFFFACGLLSKATLVVLPLVLLLLDYWPLGRLRASGDLFLPERSMPARTPHVSYVQAILEKAPLVILSMLLAIVTMYLQRTGANMASFEAMPLTFRLSNAALSVTTYLGNTFWPSRLAFFYPLHPISPSDAWTSVLLILLLSLVAVLQMRRRPHLFVGWFWFLLFLLPVIGIAQVGIQARADRYTYLPLVGLGLSMAWTVREMAAAKTGRYKTLVLAFTGLFLLAITGMAVRQVGYWRSNMDLFERAVNVTENNFTAHNNLASEYITQGQFERAEAHFRRATEIMPLEPPLFVNLGSALMRQKKYREAAVPFEQALRIKADYQPALTGLARAYILTDRLEEGLTFYEKASGSPPGSADSHRFAGVAYLGQDRLDEALEHFQRAADMNPQNPELWFRLGLTYAAMDRHAEAVKSLERSLALNPDYDPAQKTLQHSLSKLAGTNASP